MERRFRDASRSNLTLGGFCSFLRFDGTPPTPSEIEGVERAVALHGAHAASRGVIAHEGPFAAAAFSPVAGAAPERSVARDGSVLVFVDSRLVSRRDLAAELSADLPPGASGSPVGPSDPDLVLAAYRRWGVDCADRLLGDFAFVLWDGDARRLLCARDPVGVRPLHYRRTADALWVASAGRALASAEGSDGGVEVDGFFLLDALITNLRDQARSPYAGVRRLLPGHAMVALTGDGGRAAEVRGWRYWRPERAGPRWRGLGLRSEDDWVGVFGDLLRAVVRDHLETAPGSVAMLTSGGIDSSTLAAVAQRAHEAGEIASPPIAFLDVFERIRESDESEHARALVAHSGIDAEWIVADDLSDLVPEAGSGVDADSPWSVSGELSGRTLERARERGCRVITTGFGGDSLFDAARWQYFDAVRRGRVDRVLPWVSGAIARGASRPRALAAHLIPPVLGYRGRRRLDRWRGRNAYWQVPAWLSPDLRSMARERLDDQGYERRYRGFARQRQWEHIVGLAQQGPPIELWMAHAARRGLEPSFPLLDRRLAELVLAAPLEHEARPGPGGSKWMLRRAGEGLLPRSIRRRADKASWSAHVRDTLCRRLRDGVRSRFDGTSALERLGVLDGGELRDGLSRYCEGRSPGAAPSAGGSIGTVWKVERWFHESGIEALGLRYDPLEPWEVDR